MGEWNEAIEKAAKCMEAYANGNHVDRLRAARIRSLKRPSVSGGGEIENKAKALTEKLREIEADKSYQGIWGFLNAHSYKYSGPSYSDELIGLERALKPHVGE